MNNTGNSSLDTSLRTKFNQDTLVNRIHAVLVILLTLFFVGCSVASEVGMIPGDFYGAVLGMPLGTIIAVSIIFPICLIARNSDFHYAYILSLWVNIEVLCGFYLLLGENKILRFIVSSIMLVAFGFIIWFMNKDLIILGKAFSDGHFRQFPATVKGKIGITNRQCIFPATFGYLTVEVEDQIGKTYKVKVRSKLYKSLSEGDSGTLIILDEDDHKRLFIV